MKRKFKGGLTSVSLPVFIADTSSTTGGGLSGVTSASSGLVLEYRRQGQSTWTSVTAVSKTLGTYTSGGIVADGSLAGAYEVDFPDAAFASGARMVLCRIRGVTNMLPVLIEIELDAVDYQDATAFGLSRIDAAITSRMATYTQPTGFLAATFPSTVASPTNITSATGVVLASTTHTGAVVPTVTSVTNGVTVTTNNDKTGYSLSQAFPSNFASLGINASGHVSRVTLVDTTTTNTDMRGTDGAALASEWTATRAGYLDGVLLAQNYNQRTVQVTGSNHIAADVHEFQAEVITSSDFAVGAIDSNALAQDAADKIAEAVQDLQILTRLDSMIESDGAGQFRFDTIALSMAPAGGGGGGTDWTANERTAIRSVLGFDSNGTVSLPTVGVMDAIKDKTDLITSDGISVLEDRVNESTITMQYNESTTASVNLDEDTTSATLQFVVSRPDGTDILTIANGSITRTSTSFTVTITTAVTATLGQYLWSLRDITGGTNRVITKGVLTVQNAASA